MVINNKLISKVYIYKENLDNVKEISYNRKLDNESNDLIIHPPFDQKTMEYIIKNSSMVRKCSDILSKDILYNNITMSYCGYL